MRQDYWEFLEQKAVKAPWRGLDRTPELVGHLFPFQANSVAHALRVGAGGLFLDTGLGKTECQLEWCQKALEAMNGRALILTPLAVAGQTKRRADRWGYEARVIRDQSQAGAGINICNYDRAHLLNPAYYGAVSLDEASILKSFGGKTTKALTEAFRDVRFKMVATATPAPNDHMELGNYADFLSIMQPNEMLSRWFINDTSTASREWRLKGHAENDFWDWMSSWARMASMPSDITGHESDDAGFVLPQFDLRRHKAQESRIIGLDDGLFQSVNMSATSLHDVKRQTAVARADAVAGIVDAEPREARILWVDTNYEANAVLDAVATAQEISGTMDIDEKEERIAAFETGEIKYLVAKPSQCGFGLDWSHCARMVFTGRSYSYETYYQAVRRCWRFGQKRTVKVDLVIAEGEDTISRVIDRKSAGHSKMKNAMREAMRRATDGTTITKAAYEPRKQGKVPSWLRSAA